MPHIYTYIYMYVYIYIYTCVGELRQHWLTWLVPLAKSASGWYDRAPFCNSTVDYNTKVRKTPAVSKLEHKFRTLLILSFHEWHPYLALMGGLLGVHYAYFGDRFTAGLFCTKPNLVDCITMTSHEKLCITRLHWRESTWPMDSPQKRLLIRKALPCHDSIMSLPHDNGCWVSICL